MFSQLGIQIVGVLVTSAFSVAITYTMMLVYKKYNILRIDILEEIVGSDFLKFKLYKNSLDDDQF